MNARAEVGEKSIQKLARSLCRDAAQHKPSMFESRDWLGKMIEWSLADESLRVALFRFVDVLPSLDSAADIGQHLEEYFAKTDGALSGLVFLTQALHAGWLLAPVVKKNVARLARRFIVAEEPDALRLALETLRREPAAFTLDVVGEATVSETEADLIQNRYIQLLRQLASMAEPWPAIPQIDEGPTGPLPRVNLSVKVSSLYPRFDALDPESENAARERLRPIFREAARSTAALTLDMEQYAFKDLTRRIFLDLLEEPEFAARPAAAIAVQAYLRDSEQDLRDLIRWAREKRRRIGIRLVKGAYWDSEIAWAKQKHWPVPVFLEKAETDANYETLTRLLLESYPIIDSAFGSHNIRSLAHAIAAAEAFGVPKHGYEIQMLHGMGEPIRHAVVQSGERVRVYVPVGALLPGMAYLIRRLMENTSNTSFLRQTYAEKADIDKLILAPVTRRAAVKARPGKDRHDGPQAAGIFCNEPPLDFSRRENREAFAQALDAVRRKFGNHYDLWIDGREVHTNDKIASLNPAAPKEIIGRVSTAGKTDAERAMASASRFFSEWKRTPVVKRAEILFAAAEILRHRRLEFAAWEVFEVGKNWREADADVVEAIDYLEYYGREMLRLSVPRLTQMLPGEDNVYFYEPRGIAAVIAPWNFPLAILTGMTAAALVAGNCVLIKPAEQSPVIGSLMMEVWRQAGLPPGAAQLLQGGGELGAFIVRHPSVHMVAFTGSRDVGLDILAAAHHQQPGQAHVKRVICEMGGKNAIVVDRDADLDEAVSCTIESAFGYQGQKCSAASRLILVDEIFDRLLERLAEAVRTLKVGAPEDPKYFMGPVIDAAAQANIGRYIEAGKRAYFWAAEGHAPQDGFFVAPILFGGVPPDHPLAREEIFGPVLSVIKARDFDHALAIANGSPYGLTGGCFSRSPAHIEKARQEFRVGNLYINRGITGAVVERQPFGGAKLSGIGSKAGGPDYLLQFLEPRTISENTLRHGFVPPDELKRG